MMVVITICNSDHVDTGSKRGDDVVITISNGDEVDTESERGDDGG